MVANYPYFGLPNYMRYMNPNAYKNIQQQKQEYIRNNSRAQPQNRNSYYSTPYTQNNRQISQASKNSRNNLNYRPSSYKSNITKPKKEKAKQQELPPLFSFFGINLYFDDVLILCRVAGGGVKEVIFALSSTMYLFYVFCSFYIMKK